MKTNIKKIATASLIVLISISLSAGIIQASNGYYTVSPNTPITSQMGVGSRGTNVYNLQTFLASNSDIYPAGLVTGYFGALTDAAVRQYQLSYGISMVGHVGPVTIASINNTMARQYGIDVYGSRMYNISVQPFSNSAVINWTATGYNSGKVYYSTSSFGYVPAVGNFSAPMILGGSNVSTAYAANAQSVTLSNLMPHTMYYYIIEVADASGNVSVTNASTFTTN